MIGGAFVMGVALSLMRKHAGTATRACTARPPGSARSSPLVASLGVIVTGDIQGKIMTEVQPMKMAAAEGLYDTTSSAPFSVLSIGSLDGARPPGHRGPGLLSFLATGSFDGTVEGINDLQSAAAQSEKVAAQYGPQAPRCHRRQLHADHPARPTGGSG